MIMSKYIENLNKNNYIFFKNFKVFLDQIYIYFVYNLVYLFVLIFMDVLLYFSDDYQKNIPL